MLVAVALIALVVGTGFGILVFGILSAGKESDDMAQAEWTIRKQAKVIEDQGTLIAELNRQLDGLEDDGK